jgi:hypothetical protein
VDIGHAQLHDLLFGIPQHLAYGWIAVFEFMGLHVGHQDTLGAAFEDCPVSRLRLGPLAFPLVSLQSGVQDRGNDVADRLQQVNVAGIVVWLPVSHQQQPDGLALKDNGRSHISEYGKMPCRHFGGRLIGVKGPLLPDSPSPGAVPPRVARESDVLFRNPALVPDVPGH